MDPFRYMDSKELSNTRRAGNTFPVACPTPYESHDYKNIGFSHPVLFNRSLSAPNDSLKSCGTSNSLKQPRPILGPSFMPSITGGRSRSSSLCSSGDMMSWEGSSSTSSSNNSSENLRGAKCQFCFKNGETSQVYCSHSLHTYKGKQKIVECPILRQLICKLCGATGDSAHTISHCPLSKGSVSVALMLKNTPRMGSGAFRRRGISFSSELSQ